MPPIDRGHQYKTNTHAHPATLLQGAIAFAWTILKKQQALESDSVDRGRVLDEYSSPIKRLRLSPEHSPYADKILKL